MSVLTWLGRSAGSFAAAYKAAASGSTTRRAPVIDQHTRPVSGDGRTVSDMARYSGSDDVYAAVNLLVRLARLVPLRVLVNGKEALTHPLQTLLDTGPPELGRRWISWLYYYHLLTGECFARVIRTSPTGGRPIHLVPSSGQQWQVIQHKDTGAVIGYTRRCGDSAHDEVVPPEDVVRITTWNPHNTVRGLSPLASVRVGLDSERMAKEANRDLFRNGLHIDGIVAAPQLTGQRLDQIKADIRAFKESGRHGFLFVDSEVEISKLQLTPADAQYLELDKLTTRDVAKVFGIPPMFLGDMDASTFSNYETACKALIEFAVMPVVVDVCDQLTVGLARQFGPNVTIAPDTSAVSALREDLRNKADTMGVMVRAGYDRLWVARTVMGDDVPPEAVSPLVPVVLAQPEPAAPATPPVAKPAAKRLPRWTTKDYDRAAAARDELLPYCREQATKGLHAYGKPVLAAFDAAYPTKDAAEQLTPDGIWRVIADELDGGPVLEMVTNLAQHVGCRVVTATARIYGLRIEPNRTSTAVREWAHASAADRVAWIEEDTRTLLREGIAKVLDDSGTLGDVRQAILRAFCMSGGAHQAYAYDDRIENIALTELARANGHGTLVALADAGVTHHTWRSSGLAGSRHDDIDGQTRPLGEPFDVHGHKALYPAADGLPPEEACKCKCITVPAEATDED